MTDVPLVGVDGKSRGFDESCQRQSTTTFSAVCLCFWNETKPSSINNTQFQSVESSASFLDGSDGDDELLQTPGVMDIVKRTWRVLSRSEASPVIVQITYSCTRSHHITRNQENAFLWVAISQIHFPWSSMMNPRDCPNQC